MNRTSGGRPATVGRRDMDHAGSGTRDLRPTTTDLVGPGEREPLPTRVSGLPPLPADYHATLDAGLAALAIELPSPVRNAIDDHVRLLLAWTTAINLTGIREPAAVAREHVLDSLTALALLRERKVTALLDLGSGGGFPGIPLALALPARRALLVDSVGKKARFLSTVVDAIEAGDRVRVAARRAEALATEPGHRGRWPAVVVRAVAPLSELARLAFPLLEPGGVLVAWKRWPLDAELDAAGEVLAELGGGPPEVLPCRVPGLEDHVLVVVARLRDSAVRPGPVRRTAIRPVPARPARPARSGRG